MPCRSFAFCQRSHSATTPLARKRMSDGCQFPKVCSSPLKAMGIRGRQPSRAQYAERDTERQKIHADFRVQRRGQNVILAMPGGVISQRNDCWHTIGASGHVGHLAPKHNCWLWADGPSCWLVRPCLANSQKRWGCSGRKGLRSVNVDSRKPMLSECHERLRRPCCLGSDPVRLEIPLGSFGRPFRAVRRHHKPPGSRYPVPSSRPSFACGCHQKVFPPF